MTLSTFSTNGSPYAALRSAPVNTASSRFNQSANASKAQAPIGPGPRFGSDCVTSKGCDSSNVNIYAIIAGALGGLTVLALVGKAIQSCVNKLRSPAPNDHPDNLEPGNLGPENLEAGRNIELTEPETAQLAR